MVTPLRTVHDLPTAMRIGDLAKVTGKTARALRLYEEMGLLTPGERTSGNFRVYGPEAIERVRWIAKLQDLGFTLNDIQDVVERAANGNEPREGMASARSVFETRLEDVSEQIARLQTLKRELQSALAYLEGCSACGATIQPACAACDEQELETPGLVKGLAATAAEQNSTDEGKSR
jgi:DNA-binding transcriptional MerR regulator